MRFKNLRCNTLEQVQAWVAQEHKLSTDNHGQKRTTGTDDEHPAAVPVSASPCKSLISSCLATNAAPSLLNVACYLLDRQVQRLAYDFEKEGGFTERLYKVRIAKRNEPPNERRTVGKTIS